MPKLSPSAIEKNKSRIEEAAKKLFIKQGFHATSMRNIAARAGTSLGNVYNYYRTKEEILGSIIGKYQTTIDGRLRSIFDEIDEPLKPESLVRFGLGGFEQHYPAQLSGGMRQRVALMRTFLFDRDIMLLDEPFGALDALTRALMQRWLLEVWEANKRTVLFITHDIDEAIFLGDRVVVMSARPGHIKFDARVPLPRPRAPEVVTLAQFVDLKRQLLAVIEDESLKTFAAMNQPARADGAAA